MVECFAYEACSSVLMSQGVEIRLAAGGDSFSEEYIDIPTSCGFCCLFGK